MLKMKDVGLFQEDGGEIGGSGVHFPSTPVKYLADLRSRANSQRYSSIYEDQRPKIEDVERSDNRTTSRTNLTSLKPAEDFFFSFLSSFPPEFLLPFCPSVFLLFCLPSILCLFYSFFLPSFIYSFVLIFVKIPYLASNLSLFLLPSFFSFSIPFFPPSLLPFFSPPPSPFSFSHRWDNKSWSAEKTRVRPCYTHTRQLKTSEHRRLRTQHHWIPLAFYHRRSYHKPRESE